MDVLGAEIPMASTTLPTEGPHGAAADNNEITAHLERGWSLAESGDMRGAAGSAYAALDLDAESSDAYLLLGVVACSEGDPHEGLEFFRKAMSLDPEYIEPMLEAAETLAFRLPEDEADLDEAHDLCDEALALAEERSPEWVDALLLHVELKLLLGEEEGATREAARLRELEPTDASVALRAARLLIDLEDLDAAERLLGRARSLDPDSADVLHATGLLHEAQGEREQSIAAWSRVVELDRQVPSPAWAMSEEEFAETAEQALGALPEALRTRLANVPLLVEDFPAPAQLAEGLDPRSLGLFDGVPYGDQSGSGATPQLSRIYLYRRTIERAVSSREQLVEEIERTLFHETGHFFAITDEELEALLQDPE
jgi:predicted Zn-dependent protease with MMP-like domain/Flp pilus assembly protein TadD